MIRIKAQASAAKPPTPATPAASALPAAQDPDHLIAWPEIAAALLAARGIKTGWWRVGIQMRFAALTTRMGEIGHAQRNVPTALVGIDNIALFATTQGGDMVYDAANNCAEVPAGAVAPVNRAAKRAAGGSATVRPAAKRK